MHQRFVHCKLFPYFRRSMKKNIQLIVLVSFLALTLASCSTTRRKNRCNTCPTWDDKIELRSEKID
jgi:hypothetical protein